MAIDKDGFLSSEISTWIGKHRFENASSFELASRINRLALRDLLAAASPNDRSSLTMMLLFARGVTTLQSALVLAERGLTTDSRMLVRSLVETFIYFVAAKSDPDFVEKLIAQDKNHKTKVARRLVQLGPDESGLDAERSARLTEFIEARKADAGSPIALAAVAEKHGLREVYDTYYRGLSGDAAHPTVTSLNRHIVEDNEGLIDELQWGPDVKDVGDTLLAACGVSFQFLWWTQEVFGSPDNRVEFEDCWKSYNRIIDLEMQAQNSNTAK